PRSSAMDYGRSRALNGWSVSLFATDRSRELRTRRIRRLGEDAPVQSRARALLGAIPSLGAASVLGCGAILAAGIVSIGHLSALGGLREALALGLAAALCGLVVGLAARVFAPKILESWAEAGRCAGLACGALA